MTDDILTPGIRASAARQVIEGALAGKFVPRSVLVSVLAHAAAELGGRCAAPAEELSDTLAAYVNKLVFESYKVVDRDFETLRAAGYSDDAITDITLASAAGAGMARLQQGLAALGREV